MSRSFDRNIERLKANQRQVSQQEQQATTEAAQLSGDYAVRHARDISNKLVPFSKALQDWKDKDIEKQKEAGRAEARKAKLDKAKWLNDHGSETAKKLYAIEQAQAMGELAFEFEDAKAQDLEYHKLKEQLLKSGGTQAYPDADRITQLSPWQQVGFAQEQIRSKMSMYEDQLAHSLQNGTEPISLGGITYTAQEIKDNNLAFPMKQAAIEVYADKIYTNLGLDRYSDEMLKMSKVNETIQKAKDSQLAKYRQQYNIESSMKTRQKAKLEWQRSEKTAVDLQHLLVKTSNTADTKGNLIGRAGGWKQVEAILVQEGIARHNPEYAESILNQPMPASMARELGAKQGTTFAQQWPAKLSTIRKAIKKGYADEVKAEETYLKAGGKELTNEFIQEARKGDLSTDRVNEYKRKYADLGLPIPETVKNYETLSDRDEREDKETLAALIASNNGRITHEELDQYHPKAALEYREKADKFQKADLQAFGAEEKIKGHLNTTFTGMGIKGNEKSPAFIEAFHNAKADYAKKYNSYVAMGYPPDQASYLALHAQQVTNKETGEAIPDSMGVLAEIEGRGEGSKYVRRGQAIEKELKAGHVRVAQIASGKREIRDNPNIIFTGTIGGAYGQRQLNSIISNIDKYGERKGLTMDKGAIQYYKGLARGRDNNWMGLLDSQLKANGHQGLWPNGKPEVQLFMEGKDENGEQLVSQEVEGLRAAIARAGYYPSKSTLLYQRALMKDGSNAYKAAPVSIFDTQEELAPWMS